MPILLTPHALPDSPVYRPDSASNKRLRKAAEQSMAEGGGVTSASGVSAVMAVEWCVANGYSWTLRGGPDGRFYHVERGDHSGERS